MLLSAEPNHLDGCANPYLSAQARDPIHWYPWGEEALTAARREQKPIFLTVGYATCHYSRQMREESFQDAEVAGLINDGYIAVQLDRCERPDIGYMYLLVVQHMTGRSGYPMNLILTPELKPIYAATYLPKTGYGNVPGLIDLLPLLSGLWRDKREEVEANAGDIYTRLSRYLQPQAGEALTHAELDLGAAKLELIFDSHYGGFGPAPKFPLTQNLLFLLRYADLTNAEKAGAMAEQTLISMYQGGFYDHVGGGFFRYATDPVWMIPCFEKLLSDNAWLIFTYLQAYRYAEKSVYARVARETLAYVLRDLSAETGAFYAGESDFARDGLPAGYYYFWSEEEIKAILDFEADMVRDAYNIGRTGSFPDIGKTLPNLLYQPLDEKKLVFMKGLRARLLESRQQRPAPAKNRQILSGSNGLMIGALAAAAWILEDDAYLDRARQAADFIWEHLTDSAGNLFSCVCGEQVSVSSCAFDYAELIWGLLELHQASLELSYLEKAVWLQENMIQKFWDDAQGGFFFNRRDLTDADAGLAQAKNFYDADLPADNSLGALNLLKLSRLTGNREWKAMSLRQTQTFAQEIRQNPTACSFWLYTACHSFYAGNQMILLGEPGLEEWQEMIYRFRRYQHDDWLLLAVTDAGAKQAAEKIAPPVAKTQLTAGKANAYMLDEFGPAVRPIQDAESLVFALEQRRLFNRVSR
jgi:uncharacterized protein YyaL (SSP411 family)